VVLSVFNEINVQRTASYVVHNFSGGKDHDAKFLKLLGGTRA